ncbi:hypothetical protein [Actinoplanes sp. NPDC051851]|uniref:hypothetical protein n=1 Tax=Actinoplanes sp. NPDC051851 TaxID=3154753 RepID=UPI003428F774
MLQAANEGLIGWQGKSAEQAKARLAEFAEGMRSLGDDVKQIQMVMSIAKTLMEVAQGFVIGLIATFIEWLVLVWTAALAAAGPTFGGSTAAAGAATGVEGGVLTTRAMAFLTRVIALLRRLRDVLYKLHPNLRLRLQAAFQVRGPGGHFSGGFITPGTALSKSLEDWRPYAGAAVKGVTTAIQEGKRMYDARGGEGDEDQTRRNLDPDR